MSLKAQANPADRNDIVLAAGDKCLSEVNENHWVLQFEKNNEATAGPSYDQRLRELKERCEREEKGRRKAETELQSISTDLADEKQQFEDSVQVFTREARLNQEEIARLRSDCDHLMNEKQLAEQEQGRTIQKLSRDLVRLKADRNALKDVVRHLESSTAEEQKEEQQLREKRPRLELQSGGASTWDKSDQSDLIPPVKKHTSVEGQRIVLAIVMEMVSGESCMLKDGHVVVIKEYWQSLHNFAERLSDTPPGPIKCPDLQKAHATHHDVKYLAPVTASALRIAVGGTPTVTVKDGFAWYNVDAIAYCMTGLYDEKGDPLKFPNRPGDDLHVCHLPVGLTFYEALQQYLGYRPSVVKVQETGDVMQSNTTVGVFNTKPTLVNLIVIK